MRMKQENLISEPLYDDTGLPFSNNKDVKKTSFYIYYGYLFIERNVCSSVFQARSVSP